MRLATESRERRRGQERSTEEIRFSSPIPQLPTPRKNAKLGGFDFLVEFRRR
jgi:hypothetical protein